MIDFNKLQRPVAKAKVIDPNEIFAKTPNLKDAPNDLWKGQANALELWHKDREKEDSTVILNTGAGKSIVRILIGQSLVNEEIGPVVYVCSTNDLVKQTAKECDRIGIKYTTRTRGKFDNDLFETGKAFCITNYQALFTKTTAFNNDKSPAAIIFDDAHVAERIIRDSFTLKIDKSKHSQLYLELIKIIKPEFEAISKGPHLEYVIEDVGQKSVALCPPCTASRNREQIIQALKRAEYGKKADLKYDVIQLYENLQNCCIFVSSDVIEITPPFIPSGIYDFLGKGVRRVYLSATLQQETDFVRAFGHAIGNRIEPENDAGNGERLILLASEFKKELDKIEVAESLLKNQKVLISVPSYGRALEWRGIDTPPSVDDFSEELDEFRKSKSGAFILVSRIDGIDLPKDTCRVMIIDGAPHGVSLIDQYANQISLANMLSTKMASRITQLLGRINRGRSDYGAFIIFGKDINNWIKKEKT